MPAAAFPLFRRLSLRRGAPALAVLVVCAACGLAACGQKSEAGGAGVAAGTPAAGAAGAARPALSVTVALPRTAQVPVTLTANGSIAAWQEASVGAQVGGLRLADVRVNVGDVVKAGQVLATFAPETVQAAVAQSRASLLEAEAAAADARANNQRARTLADSGALSASQIAQYATSAQTADARVAAARAALRAQELQVGFTEVRAPDAGVISARSATVGAVVAPGTELFRLVRRGRLEWRAEVTSAELGRIRVGAPVTVTAASGAVLDGTVRTLAPTVDPQTRNALVYVDLPTASRNGLPARAGMFATGDFRLGAGNALTVPQGAVVVRDGFSYVFVPEPLQQPAAAGSSAAGAGELRQVAMRKVQTGARLGTSLAVTAGLDAQTPVVTSGAGFLNERDVVRVVPEAAPATPADAAPKTPAAGARPGPAAIK